MPAMAARVGNTSAVTYAAHLRRSAARLTHLTAAFLSSGASRSGDLGSKRCAGQYKKSNQCRKIAADLALLHFPSNPELVHSGAEADKDGFSTAFLLGSIGFADSK